MSYSNTQTAEHKNAFGNKNVLQMEQVLVEQMMLLAKQKANNQGLHSIGLINSLSILMMVNSKLA